MITKKILEKEIEINLNRIKNEERLQAGLENAFADGEITLDEFDIELMNIHNNIYHLEQDIETYKFLINKYCKRA